MELFLVQRVCELCGDIEDWGIFSSLDNAKKGIRKVAGLQGDLLGDFDEETWNWPVEDDSHEGGMYYITPFQLDEIAEYEPEEYNEEQDEQ